MKFSIYIFGVILSSIFLFSCSFFRLEQDNFPTINEEDTINHTTDKKVGENSIYRNDEFGLEMVLPKGYKIFSEVNSDGSCMRGKILQFFIFNEMQEAPKNSQTGIGVYDYSGSIKSSDYKQLEYSTEDGSFCGPVFGNDIPYIEIQTPYKLTATHLRSMIPTQSVSCSFYQKIIKTDKDGRILDMTFSLPEFDLTTEETEQLGTNRQMWKSICPAVFKRNTSPQLEVKVQKFEQIVQSIHFD